MSLVFNHSHFDAQEPDAGRPSGRESLRARPVLPSLTSSASIPAAATTALSDVPIRTQSIIDTREGLVQEENDDDYDDDDDDDDDDGQSTKSRVPTLKSMETDLVDSLTQVLLEGGDQQSSSASARELEMDAEILQDVQDSQELTAAQVEDLPEEEQLSYFLSRDKHYMILSSAGKPIYSRYGSEQIISGYMGIIQAIMGFYQDSSDPDVLQSFSSSGLQVVLLVKGPVYLVAISKLGESETTLKSQLEFLYEVVVSSLTSTSMSRLFERGDNFDLGRLLSGSETFMDKICDGLTSGRLHLDVQLGSLSVLRLRATFRSRINNIMANYRPDQKRCHLLYGMIAVDKKLVSVLRPKGHSLYPADLRLVFETVWERGFEEGQDYWVPLCLPKFNPTGYLHLFISFLAPSVAILLLSADKDDFFQLQTMKMHVAQKLEKEGLIRDLVRARSNVNQIGTKMLGIADIVDHFIFKSREHVQYICPEFSIPKRNNEKYLSKAQCLKIYDSLSGPASRQYKLQIRRYILPHGETSVMALTWTTRAFELLVISRVLQTSQNIDVNKLIGAANVIHQFVRREEARVWVDQGITF